MRHRSQKLLESSRAVVAAATKRMTLWFAEGCVESLVTISEMQQDAAKEEDERLYNDIDDLLKELGVRDEKESN